MILGYLMRKINILLFVFIITGCSTINTNNFNIYDDIFVKKEVNCPLINTPKGSEELIAISPKNNNTSYIGFRGIKKTCFLSDDKINMKLTVNLRSVRKNFQNDDFIKIKIALVSTKNNNAEFDRDDFELGFFLKSGSEIVERETNMSIIVPRDGKVYIGLFQN
tara:strand:- start:11 stop:502 length:492 start_codon:yes stop_codon:yes gene_type:complete